jgi:hypothetical protein
MILMIVIDATKILSARKDHPSIKGVSTARRRTNWAARRYCRNALRLILGHEISRRSAPGLFLVIHIRKRAPVPVLHNEAGVVMVFDGPGRREAARGHVGFGP